MIIIIFYLSISALKNIRYSLCFLSSSLKDLLLMMLDFQDYWQVRIEIIIVIFIDIYDKTYSKCVSISPSKIVWYSKCPHVMQGLSFSSSFFLRAKQFWFIAHFFNDMIFSFKTNKKIQSFCFRNVGKPSFPWWFTASVSKLLGNTYSVCKTTQIKDLLTLADAHTHEYFKEGYLCTR